MARVRASFAQKDAIFRDSLVPPLPSYLSFLSSGAYVFVLTVAEMIRTYRR